MAFQMLTAAGNSSFSQFVQNALPQLRTAGALAPNSIGPLPGATPSLYQQFKTGPFFEPPPVFNPGPSIPRLDAFVPALPFVPSLPEPLHQPNQPAWPEPQVLPPSGPSAYPPPQLPAQPGAPPVANFDVGGAVAGINCNSLPDGPYKVACQVAQGLAGALSPGGNRGANQGGLAPTGCPTGYVWDGTKCEASFGRDMGGPLVASAGGMMGLGQTPTQVGTIRRKDGTTGPILRCTKGWILGIDYFCYPKAMLPKNLRAHPPGTKPLLTGGDVRILSKARSLEKKVKRLSSRYVRKPCSCKVPTRRKK